MTTKPLAIQATRIYAINWATGEGDFVRQMQKHYRDEHGDLETPADFGLDDAVSYAMSLADQGDFTLQFWVKDEDFEHVT